MRQLADGGGGAAQTGNGGGRAEGGRLTGGAGEVECRVRLILLLTGLAVLILIPFVIWGDSLMARFSGEGAREWLAGQGRLWAWLPAMGLLVSDLVLPVPATAVMGALGYVYGAVAGGGLGAAGSFLSGTAAYELCRRGGAGAAARLLGGPEERARAERIFAGRPGGWLVAAGRCLPLLPEISSCMAGLAGMARRRYYPALACGCVPAGMVYASIGAAGHDRPGLALGLSAAVPVLLYPVALRLMRNGGKPGNCQGPDTGGG